MQRCVDPSPVQYVYLSWSQAGSTNRCWPGQKITLLGPLTRRLETTHLMAVGIQPMSRRCITELCLSSTTDTTPARRKTGQWAPGTPRPRSAKPKDKSRQLWTRHLWRARFLYQGSLRLYLVHRHFITKMFWIITRSIATALLHSRGEFLPFTNGNPCCCSEAALHYFQSNTGHLSCARHSSRCETQE